MAVRRAFLEQLAGRGEPSPKAADAALPAPSAIALLLNRTSFGIREAELSAATAVGYDAWLEYQLAWEQIDVAPLESQLATALPTLAMTNGQLLEQARAGGDQFQAVNELRVATFLRQVFSPRQLYEVMVEFWTNHFNVQHIDGPVRWFKTVEDRELIRRNALGRFSDLLRGDARSPAMLYYLDNYVNVAAGPNENYARELLELHTLGVNGGYSEADVAEVARCFTGWTYTGGLGGVDVQFTFVRGRHDTGAKTVLGQSIAAGRGIEDGDQVLDILLAHPSTARFLATKLVRRFVDDAPPASLVDAVAATYASSGGDIKAMLRTLLRSDEFKASADRKVRRPVEFLFGALRTLEATVSGSNYLRTIGEELNTLGQLHYFWPTPDGYPDTQAYWTNTAALLERINIGLALAENTLSPGIRVDVAALAGDAGTPEQLVDRLAQRLLRRPLAAADRARLVGLATGPRGMGHRPLASAETLPRARELVGTMLGSPYFQYR
ncbi:MAG TPA: DUF1800 domain-containing protein [Xanthomonadales bacterium]|nr:DUF1800 domain-containing protein [Xanthomonadales bacterium]